MQYINLFVQLTCWVRSKTLQTFVKNLGAPCCVIAFVKGIAINCKRCLAEHAEIVHKNSSYCGFQDHEQAEAILRIFK